MNTYNAYDKLYNQMKNTFTVVSDNCEYTLGEYMLMKAGHKKGSSNLPVAKNASSENAISAIFRYVNDKLTVKVPPVKDKTIRRFPLRTACAALLSAIVVSTLIFSYGSVSMNGVSNVPAATVEAEKENENKIEQNFDMKK